MLKYINTIISKKERSDNSMEYLKTNLIYLRHFNHLSYRKLADASGVNYISIYKIESGESKEQISLKTFIKLAEYFNVSLDDFVYKDLSKQGYDDNDEAKNDCCVEMK